MDQEELQELVRKYVNGTATDLEKDRLSDWYQLQNISETEWIADINDEEQSLREEMFSVIQKQITGINFNKVKPLWPRMATIAASILLLLSFGVYFLIYHKATNLFAQNQKIDIGPGHSQATLTLANGKKIVLTKGLTGTLAQQGNILVAVKNALTYTLSGTNASAYVQYNTLSTANGEQSPYPLVLADGTKVWLNAKSSITFPTAFRGNTRLVQVTGEAYFEVVHNSLKPFRVSVKGQTIEDIGTHFDINAYNDEPKMVTTLLEGGISISQHGETAILKPGQQAQTGMSGRIEVIDNADIEEAVAWKNGLFKFSHVDIKAIMRQFSRWYNVDVAYEGNTPTEGISGEIYRNVNASQALEILKDLNIHYRVEKINGINKIIIAP